MKKALRSAKLYINTHDEPIKNPKPLWEVKLRYFYRTLKSLNWNLTKTARALEISIRTARNYVVLLRGDGIRIPTFHVPNIKSKEARKRFESHS